MTDTERPYYNPYIIEGPATVEAVEKARVAARKATGKPPTLARLRHDETIPCFYCGKHVKHGTIDHLTPRIRGGSNEASNRVKACQPCNWDKNNLTLAEYRLVIAYRRGALTALTNDHDFFGSNSLFKFPGEQVG